MSVPVPLFDIGSAHDRVVRLTNVHYEATANDVRRFFKDFTILDQYRTFNPRTRTRSVVYVLFASARDKNASRALKGGTIRGRRVDVMPARTGNYRINEDNTGFIQDGNSAVPTTPSTAVTTAVTTPPLFNAAEFPALSRGLALTNLKSLAEDEEIPSSIEGGKTSPAVNEPAPKIDPKTAIWGATQDELAQAHASTFAHLKPMPSGIEGPRQIVTVGDAPYPKEHSEGITVASPEHCLPNLLGGMNIHEQPAHLARSASAEETWNLWGTQDGILTADQWYNFEAEQARKD